MIGSLSNTICCGVVPRDCVEVIMCLQLPDADVWKCGIGSRPKSPAFDASSTVDKALQKGKPPEGYQGADREERISAAQVCPKC